MNVEIMRRHYDALNRILTLTENQRDTAGNWTTPLTQGFGYDRWGNRLSVTGYNTRTYTQVAAAFDPAATLNVENAPATVDVGATLVPLGQTPPTGVIVSVTGAPTNPPVPLAVTV